MNQLTTVTQTTIQGLMEKYKAQFKAALPPSVMDVDRFTRIALTDFRSTPALANCDAKSFLGALMMCAQLGLEPGKGLGHAYIIPYNSKNGLQATFILGYRGMIDLARRSGQIVSISAHEVYENDFFEYEYGLNEKLTHKPANGERGSLTHVYAIARLVGGGYQMDVMSKFDVDTIRKRSKSGQYGPWVTDYAEMAKKTVIRRMFKYLPISIENSTRLVERAIIADEAADRGDQESYFDVEFEDIDQENKSPKESTTEEVIKNI